MSSIAAVRPAVRFALVHAATFAAGVAIFLLSIYLWGNVVINPSPLAFLAPEVPRATISLVEEILRGITVPLSLAGIWLGLHLTISHLPSE